MSAKAEAFGRVAELIAIYGPAFAPWVMALASLCVFGLWVRHFARLVEMSESLRASMMVEKQRCEEASRLKDSLIQELTNQRHELVAQHTAARQTFLENERERDEAIRKLKDQLASMQAMVEVLTEQLEAHQLKQKRSTDL
jgi:hypothetical protein